MKIVRTLVLAACALGFAASLSASAEEKPSPMARPPALQHCLDYCHSAHSDCIASGTPREVCEEQLSDCILSCY